MSRTEVAINAVPEVLFVRFRKGVVGETKRSVHVVPIPGHTNFAHLTAYCGQKIGAGEAELLDENHGSMPCEGCLAAAPAPGLDAARTVERQSLRRIDGFAKDPRLFLHQTPRESGMCPQRSRPLVMASR